MPTVQYVNKGHIGALCTLYIIQLFQLQVQCVRVCKYILYKVSTNTYVHVQYGFSKCKHPADDTPLHDDTAHTTHNTNRMTTSQCALH